MIKADDLFKIGQIKKTFAKRGELLMQTANDMLEVTDTDFLWLSVDKLFVPFYLVDYRYKSDDTLILQLEDIDTESKAQTLIGAEVFVEKNLLPADAPIKADLTSLVGYKVFDEKAGELGIITAIDDTTANLLITLSTDILLPLHDDLIQKIDTQRRSLHLSLPEGLLSLQSVALKLAD